MGVTRDPSLKALRMGESEILLGAVALFLIIRIFPVWRIRHQGCDAYFFLLCAEVFRRKWRLPIVLPGLFLLEPDEQWYPPGFIVFCGLFPEGILKRYYWLISHLVDGLVGVSLFVACRFLTGSEWIALGAVGAYATAPRMVAEYVSLTSRPLGALLLVIFLASTWWWYGGKEWGLAAAVVSGVALIFTHKLSMQLLWFLMPFLAVVYVDWRWLVPLATAYAVAALIGRGLLVKILRAHQDIVAFWHRNWRWLGAHVVKDSPVYGFLPPRAGHYRHDDPRAWLRFALELGHMNYFALFLPVAFWRYEEIGDFGQFCFWWAVGTYVWAAATHYLSFLRGLGLSVQYLKLSHAPVLVVVAILLVQANSIWLWGLAMVCALLTLVYYALTIRALRRNAGGSTARMSPDLERAFVQLRNCVNARILTLPLQLSEMTAYVVRRPVLWGGHGYGFTNIELLYPILRQPIEWFSHRYCLTHLLLDERYVAAEILGLSDGDVVFQSGPFRVCRLPRLVDRSGSIDCRRPCN